MSRSRRLAIERRVVRDRSVQFHGAFAGRANDDFFHVQIGSVEQAAFFAGGEDGDRAGRAGGAKVGALEGIDGDIDRGEIEAADMLRGADFFADEEHGRFVALAFADDDGAVHWHFVHDFAHGFDGGLIGFVAVAQAHGACADSMAAFSTTRKNSKLSSFSIGCPPASLDLWKRRAYGCETARPNLKCCPI